MRAMRCVPWTTGKVEFTVSRKHALYDAFNVLGNLSEDQWRQPFFVKFRGEAGLDAGGLSREFFQLASSQLVAPDLGLFRPASDGTYDLVEDKDASTAHDKNPAPWFTFAGQLLGKALFEGHHLSTLFHLNRLLLKYVATEPIELDDLELTDPELREHEPAPLHVERDGRGSDADVFRGPRRVRRNYYKGSRRERPRRLRDGRQRGRLPGGAAAGPRLRRKAWESGRVFEGSVQRGAAGCCCRRMLLSARELELVLFGAPDIDVNEWRRSTVYRGALEESSDVVEMFWAEVEGWPVEKRARLLQWCTGSTRVPVGGFDQLQGRTARCVAPRSRPSSLDQAVVSSAHTCFNRIDLPLFTDRTALSGRSDVALRTDRWRRWTCGYTPRRVVDRVARS